ncbi:hypothetical protein [Chroococcidiopsis sp. TS-821]|uniref:hypothetical protein n=1 Tax=Chroococcidiopsis sp. TS-821 TaxID=1378066 RepID=UPI00143D0BD7|nr:hypothetical protein [Chroococcidiopsis sp. TS-821]
MNTPEEEHIAYVVVEQINTNPAPTVKRIKLMNTPEEEQITYIAVEPNKSNTMQIRCKQ